MPDFPSSPKPCYPLEETAQNPEVLVSTHKDGSEQRRLKGAGSGRQFTLQYGTPCPITGSQRNDILSHFSGENGSASSFSFTHPETAVAYTVRYVEAPVFRCVGYNAYQGTVKLKVVPA